MIKRNGQTIITKGDTVIYENDNVILSVPPYVAADNEELQERTIEKNDEWCNKTIEELHLKETEIIAMIIRGDENIIPDGKTMILSGDKIVMCG